MTARALVRTVQLGMVLASATEAWCTEIPGGVDAACTARESLTDTFGGALPDETMHDLHLLTTELVTNAVLHAGASESDAIELQVAPASNSLRVSVTDPGRTDETPHVEKLDWEVPGGMGLYLVEQISSRWGVDRLGDGAHRVWFELAA
jgi:anti-sigma regulatory factor (Ser/Thr protein kinase)